MKQQIDNIWVIIAGMVVMIILFTVLGWMDWADDKPQPQETAPVDVQRAIQSGGLELHPY
jgi:hypothetical protein